MHININIFIFFSPLEIMNFLFYKKKLSKSKAISTFVNYGLIHIKFLSKPFRLKVNLILIRYINSETFSDIKSH